MASPENPQAAAMRHKLAQINERLAIGELVKVAMLLRQNEIISEANYQAAIAPVLPSLQTAAQLMMAVLTRINHRPEDFRVFIKSLQTAELEDLATDLEKQLNAELQRRE